MYLYYNYNKEDKKKSFYKKGSLILKSTYDFIKFLDTNRTINIKEIFDFYKEENDFYSISSNYRGRSLYDSNDLKSIIRFETMEIIKRDIKIYRCLGCKKLIVKNTYCDFCRKKVPVEFFRERNKNGSFQDPMLTALTNSYQAKRYYTRLDNKDMAVYCKEISNFYNIFKNMLNYLENEIQKTQNRYNKIIKYEKIRKEIYIIIKSKNYDAIFFECIALLKRYEKEVNEYKDSIKNEGELKRINRVLYVVNIGRDILNVEI